MQNPVVASLGLVSDTHFQDRLFDLPANLENLWGEVDLILHAGDVGDLEVLDQIGRLAPVVAVHGNDEPDHVKRDLPYQPVIALHDWRILLWHSHYPDPVEEKARRPGVWGPKLARIADRGREVNARVVVYGHTHVPLISRHHDVWLINPGALASGNYFTRQAIRSVGKLQLLADGEMEVTHYDVDSDRARVFAAAQLEEDFDVLARQYQDWIVEPELIPVIGALRKIVYEDIRAVAQTIVPLYKRCLSDGLMRRGDLIGTITASDQITPNDKRSILTALGER